MSKPTYHGTNFRNCKRTYVVLSIKHRELDPEELSAQLGIQPSYAFRPGTRPLVWGHMEEAGSWVLSTELKSLSLDLERHIDWILHSLEGKLDYITDLKEKGYTLEMRCVWEARNVVEDCFRPGQIGGPSLSARCINGLAALGVDIDLDFNCLDLVHFPTEISDDFEKSEYIITILDTVKLTKLVKFLLLSAAESDGDLDSDELAHVYATKMVEEAMRGLTPETMIKDLDLWFMGNKNFYKLINVAKFETIMKGLVDKVRCMILNKLS